MTTIVTILTEGFADWETGLLNAVARRLLQGQGTLRDAGRKARDLHRAA